MALSLPWWLNLYCFFTVMEAFINVKGTLVPFTALSLPWGPFMALSLEWGFFMALSLPWGPFMALSLEGGFFMALSLPWGTFNMGSSLLWGPFIALSLPWGPFSLIWLYHCYGAIAVINVNLTGILLFKVKNIYIDHQYNSIRTLFKYILTF